MRKDEINESGREKVVLYVYDLSRGLAKQFGPMLGIQVRMRNVHS